MSDVGKTIRYFTSYLNPFAGILLIASVHDHDDCKTGRGLSRAMATALRTIDLPAEDLRLSLKSASEESLTMRRAIE